MIRSTPEEALAKLRRGHERYRDAQTETGGLTPHRAELSKGQQPIAAILSCADSRVVPEYLFDQSAGRLLVTRVAGNFVTNEILASIEFGIRVLEIPLVVVLGHSACAAIETTATHLSEGTALPGKLDTLVAGLTASVEAVRDQPGPLIENATRENVRRNVAALCGSEPILAPAITRGGLRVQGAIFDVATGSVEFLD